MMKNEATEVSISFEEFMNIVIRDAQEAKNVLIMKPDSSVSSALAAIGIIMSDACKSVSAVDDYETKVELVGIILATADQIMKSAVSAAYENGIKNPDALIAENTGALVVRTDKSSRRG